MTTRDATVIVYPETDGLPLPDGDFQAPLYIRTVSTLRIHFADVPGSQGERRYVHLLRTPK